MLFRHGGAHDYVLDTKDAVLNVENVNFIALDWSRGLILSFSTGKNCYSL